MNLMTTAQTAHGKGMIEEQPLLLRAEEAARLTSLGRSTIFKMLACGELPAVRVGRAVRVRRADLEKWIDGRAGVASAA